MTWVQVREKALSSGAFLKRARELAAMLKPRAIPLIVNDRLDIALACGADGVHLGQDDLPCEDARRIAGPDFIIGISATNEEEARQAERAGADYLGVGPVWSTPTKPDAAKPMGIEGLRAIRRAVKVPLVGVGGIGAANVEQVLCAGCDGVAVVSAIMSAADPAAASRELAQAIFRGRHLERWWAKGNAG